MASSGLAERRCGPIPRSVCRTVARCAGPAVPLLKIHFGIHGGILPPSTANRRATRMRALAEEQSFGLKAVYCLQHPRTHCLVGEASCLGCHNSPSRSHRCRLAQNSRFQQSRWIRPGVFPIKPSAVHWRFPTDPKTSVFRLKPPPAPLSACRWPISRACR